MISNEFITVNYQNYTLFNQNQIYFVIGMIILLIWGRERL